MEHIREHHAVSTTFSNTCGMNGCLRHFKNFLSFRMHVYQWHEGDSDVSKNPTIYMVPAHQTPLEQQLIPYNTEEEVYQNEISSFSDNGKNLYTLYIVSYLSQC